MHFTDRTDNAFGHAAKIAAGRRGIDVFAAGAVGTLDVAHWTTQVAVAFGTGLQLAFEEIREAARVCLRGGAAVGLRDYVAVAGEDVSEASVNARLEDVGTSGIDFVGKVAEEAVNVGQAFIFPAVVVVVEALDQAFGAVRSVGDRGAQDGIEFTFVAALTRPIAKCSYKWLWRPAAIEKAV